MESEEDKKKKVDLLHTAVHNLLEQRRINKNIDLEERLLLSKLLSQVFFSSLNPHQFIYKSILQSNFLQLESLEEDPHTTCLMKCPNAANCCGGNKNSVIEEIAKELKRIKKQNLISHFLLAVMIVVTAAWQMSEVSMLLSVKEKICNPFKFVGSLFHNPIKLREKKSENEGATWPVIAVPQVPDIDLTFMPFNSNDSSNGNES